MRTDGEASLIIRKVFLLQELSNCTNICQEAAAHARAR
jgi:hypothetical protein